MWVCFTHAEARNVPTYDTSLTHHRHDPPSAFTFHSRKTCRHQVRRWRRQQGRVAQEEEERAGEGGEGFIRRLLLAVHGVAGSQTRKQWLVSIRPFCPNDARMQAGDVLISRATDVTGRRRPHLNYCVGWTLSHISCGLSCFIAQIAFTLSTFGHRLSIHPAVINNSSLPLNVESPHLINPSVRRPSVRKHCLLQRDG